MFKSIQIWKFIGQNTYTDKHIYEFVIEDDDFKIVIAGEIGKYWPLYQCYLVILIQEYEKRKLNVAANILCLTQGFLKNAHFENGMSLFDFWKTIPEYKKYQIDVEKYIILME